MSFLRKSLWSLENTFRLERLPKRVGDAEQISRFVFSAKYIKGGVVRPSAFDPPRGKSGISVYRTDGCSSEKTWWLGERFVEGKRSDGRKIVGRADLPAGPFYSNELHFDNDGKPHARHANVEGFPPLRTPECKQITVDLAQSAIAVAKPE